jgi:diguanylate cyclase (GGDEF)-like protein
VQYVGVQNDVSDRVRAEMQLREERDRAEYMARHDLLTGLPSRQEFNDRADGILAELPDTETAVVLFIDLNDFKRVNDRYGHDTGDDVLRQSARELRRLCGRDVLLARQSGDEFVALFTSPDAQEAIDRAQALAAAVSEQMLEHPVVGVVSASAGSTLSSPGQRASLDQMLAGADAAMYANKRRRGAPLAAQR